MCNLPGEPVALDPRRRRARDAELPRSEGNRRGARPVRGGPVASQLSRDDIGLSVASQYRFLELAATEANDQLLGLHVAAEMDLRSIGILFYLTGSAQTVSEALEKLARYSATTNEALVVEISRSKDEVTLAVRHAQEFDESPRQFSELLTLWFVRTLHKETNRRFNPLRVTFTHARNSDLREVHRLLRCPVDFAQVADTWVLPRRVMDLPIVSADSHLLQILTAHADNLLAERHSVGGLQSMVVNQLVDLLPSGESRAAVVAQRLNMSTRSFTRHLAEEGTTFAEILERLRQRLASRYLADDKMSIQQVAWLLGYTEPGAFTHAYKRWTGTTPRRARKFPPARDKRRFLDERPSLFRPKDRSRTFILAFAASCVLGSAYGFLQGAWPFGLLEAIWSLVALRRWLRRRAAPV